MVSWDKMDFILFSLINCKKNIVPPLSNPNITFSFNRELDLHTDCSSKINLFGYLVGYVK